MGKGEFICASRRLCAGAQNRDQGGGQPPHRRDIFGKRKVTRLAFGARFAWGTGVGFAEGFSAGFAIWFSSGFAAKFRTRFPCGFS